MLPAGEVVRHRRQALGQSDPVQQGTGLGDGNFSWFSEHVDRRFDHIFEHGEMGEELKLLENRSHTAPELL